MYDFKAFMLDECEVRYYAIILSLHLTSFNTTHAISLIAYLPLDSLGPLAYNINFWLRSV